MSVDEGRFYIGDRALANVQEAGTARPAEELSPGPGKEVASDRCDIDGRIYVDRTRPTGTAVCGPICLMVRLPMTRNIAAGWNRRAVPTIRCSSRSSRHRRESRAVSRVICELTRPTAPLRSA